MDESGGVDDIMLLKVLEYIENNHMISTGDRVVVGVSGGVLIP